MIRNAARASFGNAFSCLAWQDKLVQRNLMNEIVSRGVRDSDGLIFDEITDNTTSNWHDDSAARSQAIPRSAILNCQHCFGMTCVICNHIQIMAYLSVTVSHSIMKGVVPKAHRPSDDGIRELFQRSTDHSAERASCLKSRLVIGLEFAAPTTPFIAGGSNDR